MPSTRPRRVMIGMLLLGACLLAGCGKKIWITQYPPFYEDRMKGMSVAVMPFSNAADAKGSGSAISDALTTALMSNGTYSVYDRNHLKAVMDERDLQIATGGDTAAVAAKFRDVGQVKAILVGSVTNYTSTSRNEPRQEPIYGYDRNGNSYVAGYRSYVYTRNEANVAATAALIRVSDNGTIYATSGPLSAKSWAEGSPPNRDPYGCLQDAARLVVSQLLEQFAVVRKQVTVNPSKDLRTAAGIYDNKWQYVDSFGDGDEQMLIVLRLPPECDRNRFRLTIIREGMEDDLAEQQVTWSRGDSELGKSIAFNPSEIATAGGGPGAYVIKFYSGPEPVMTRNFKIVSGATIKKKASVAVPGAKKKKKPVAPVAAETE